MMVSSAVLYLELLVGILSRYVNQHEQDVLLRLC